MQHNFNKKKQSDSKLHGGAGDHQHTAGGVLADGSAAIGDSGPLLNRRVGNHIDAAGALPPRGSGGVLHDLVEVARTRTLIGRRHTPVVTATASAATASASSRSSKTRRHVLGGACGIEQLLPQQSPLHRHTDAFLCEPATESFGLPAASRKQRRLHSLLL